MTTHDHARPPCRAPGRPRRAAGPRARLAFVALAVLLLSACSSAEPTSSGPTGTQGGADGGGELVSAASLVPLGGGATSSLRDYRGRPMVVNLWASWCVPCRTEMPELEAAHQRYGDRVVFVGVTDDPNTEAARQVAADTGVTYPLLFDEAGDVQVDLGVANLPATVFVDGAGRIVSKKLGKVTADDVESGIAGVLGGGS